MKKMGLVIMIMTALMTLHSCGSRDMAVQNGQELDRDAIEWVLPDDVRELVESGRYDDDIIDILQSLAYQDLSESVYDQITSSFLEGEIDRRTYALLMLQAVYSPQSLPPNFDGPKYQNDRIELMNHLQWLINHQHELDPEMEAAVRPFLLSPLDPDSYYHHAYDTSRNPLKDLSLLDKVHAVEPGDIKMKSVVIPGAHQEVTIYYVTKDKSSAQQEEIEQKVSHMAEALQLAWPNYLELLGVQPERRLDVFLVGDNRLQGSLGEANFRSSETSHYYSTARGNIDSYTILINDTNQPGKMIRRATVHELFHIFQFEMGLTWLGVQEDSNWLMEATATWAEHFVYPGYNIKHEYLNEFGASLFEDRLSTKGSREYGSYLFFYFFAESLNNKDIVTDVLKRVSALGATVKPEALPYLNVRGVIMEVINERLGSNRDIYGKFARYNWNREPCRYYQDVDEGGNRIGLPFSPRDRCLDVTRYVSASVPAGPVEKEGTVVWACHPSKIHLNDLLEPGGILYRVYLFEATPEEMPKVEFDFKDENVTYPGEPSGNDMQWVHRQALVKIGSTWSPEPEGWTELENRVFCRENAQENVTAVVMILSNANLSDNARHMFVLDTSGKCADLKGFVRIRGEAHATDAYAQVVDEWEIYAEEELTYHPEIDSYVITKITITINGLYRSRFVDPWELVMGRTVWNTDEVQSSGQLSGEYGLEEKIIRLSIHEDAHGKEIIMEPIPSLRSKDWITEIHTWDFIHDHGSEKRSTSLSPLLFEAGLYPGTPVNGIPDWDGFRIGSKTYTDQLGTIRSYSCDISDDSIAVTETRITGNGSGKSVLEFRYDMVTPLNTK